MDGTRKTIKREINFRAETANNYIIMVVTYAVAAGIVFG
jgi:hypothetical protein